MKFYVLIEWNGKGSGEIVATSNDKNGHTLSLDEIKRQHGVSTAQLEQGFDQLNYEQIQSKLAGDEEEMLGGFGKDLSDGYSNRFAPILTKCMHHWKKQPRHVYNALVLPNGEPLEIWEKWYELGKMWRENGTELMSIRELISQGKLDNSSDHVR